MVAKIPAKTAIIMAKVDLGDFSILHKEHVAKKTVDAKIYAVKAELAILGFISSIPKFNFIVQNNLRQLQDDWEYQPIRTIALVSLIFSQLFLTSDIFFYL